MTEIISTLLLAAGKPIVKHATKAILNNRENLGIRINTKFGRFKNQDIRFSMSYLIKIQIPNTSKYLLVRGSRIKEQLQPVGGVYQKHNGFSEFNDWGYKPDCSRKGVGVDEVSAKDLRFRVKGKYVLDVLKWYETRKGREITFQREFNEELLDTGILDSDIFAHADFDLTRKVIKPLGYSQHHQIHEVLVYDIVELLPNDQQKKELAKLLERPRNIDENFMVVDISEIEHLRVIEAGKQIAKIGEHSRFLINEK